MKQQTKQTEIGEIPVDWRVISLNDKKYFELIMGQSPPSSSYNTQKNGLPFLQGNAEFGEKYPVVVKYTNQPLKTAIEKDILMSVRAPVGEINISDKKICIGRGLGAIRLIDGNYLFYYYYLEHIKYLIKNLGQGSTFQAITNNELKKIYVPAPPIEEQTAIAKILSTTDEALDELERERQATERLRRGFMVKLLENQKWKVVKLGEIVEFSKGKKPKTMINEKKEGYLPYLSTDYLRENLETKYVSSSEDVILSNDGEIILLWDGSNAGEFFEGKEGVLSTTMVKFSLKTDIHQKYLLYLLKSKQNYLQGQTNGTGIPHVDRKVLMDLDITLPPIEEQKRIAEILSTIDKKLELQKARKEKIERVKKGLMDELLTGKKRVNVDKVLGDEK